MLLALWPLTRQKRNGESGETLLAVIFSTMNTRLPLQ